MYERKEVDRIILLRLELASALVFFPATCEKVDPYAPILTTVIDLMDACSECAVQAGEREIAPLAFMRGRTLSNAAVTKPTR